MIIATLPLLYIQDNDICLSFVCLSDVEQNSKCFCQCFSVSAKCLLPEHTYLLWIYRLFYEYLVCLEHDEQLRSKTQSNEKEQIPHFLITIAILFY